MLVGIVYPRWWEKVSGIPGACTIRNCLSGSFTAVMGKSFRHPRRMHNPQFYTSGKKPMPLALLTIMVDIRHQMYISLAALSYYSDRPPQKYSQGSSCVARTNISLSVLTFLFASVLYTHFNRVNQYLYVSRLLTHWGRVMHICVNKLTITGSDNGLAPGRGYC